MKKMLDIILLVLLNKVLIISANTTHDVFETSSASTTIETLSERKTTENPTQITSETITKTTYTTSSSSSSSTSYSRTTTTTYTTPSSLSLSINNSANTTLSTDINKGDIHPADKFLAIAVGIGVFVACVIIGIVIFLRHKKMRNSNNSEINRDNKKGGIYIDPVEKENPEPATTNNTSKPNQLKQVTSLYLECEQQNNAAENSRSNDTHKKYMNVMQPTPEYLESVNENKNLPDKFRGYENDGFNENKHFYENEQQTPNKGLTLREPSHIYN